MNLHKLKEISMPLISTKAIIVLISVFLLLATNTLGFDGYFHAVSISSVENIHQFNSPWVLFDQPIPRYLLFHYFFFAITFFGLFPFYPILGILLSAILIDLIKLLKGRSPLLVYACIVFFIINTVFFSALSFSVLLLLNGAFSSGNKRNFYLFLGSMMHPIGLLLGSCYLLLTRSWALLILCLSFVFLLAFFTQGIDINEDRIFGLNTLYQLGHDDRVMIVDKVIGKLKVEGLFFLIILIIYHLTNRYKISLKFIPKFKIYYLLLFSFLLSCYSINAQFRTGGIYSAFHMYFSESSTLVEGKLNILVGSWVSPIFFNNDVISDQYYFRDSKL